MKKIYLNPALEVVAIRKQDIIATSTSQYDDSGNLKMGNSITDDGVTYYGL